MEMVIKDGIIVLIYDKEINICDTINLWHLYVLEIRSKYIYFPIW